MPTNARDNRLNDEAAKAAARTASGAATLVQAGALPTDFLPSTDASEPPLDYLALLTRQGDLLGGYKDPLFAARDAILSSRALSWRAADEFVRMSEAHRGVFVSQAQGIMDNALEAKGPDVARRLGEQFLAKSQPEIAQGTRQATRHVTRVFGADAEAAATACVTTMKAVDAALAAGRTRSEFAALSSKWTADDVARIEVLERELEAKPFDAIWSTYDALVKRQDWPTVRLFNVALAAFLKRFFATSINERLAVASQQARKEIRQEGITQDNATANALLRAIGEAKQMMMEPELLLATDAYLHLLVPAFRFYVGRSTWDMSAPEFSTEGGKPLDPLSVAERWYARNLPWSSNDHDAMMRDPLLRARRGYTGLGPAGYTFRLGRTPARGAANLIANPAFPVQGA